MTDYIDKEVVGGGSQAVGDLVRTVRDVNEEGRELIPADGRIVDPTLHPELASMCDIGIGVTSEPKYTGIAAGAPLARPFLVNNGRTLITSSGFRITRAELKEPYFPHWETTSVLISYGTDHEIQKLSVSDDGQVIAAIVWDQPRKAHSLVVTGDGGATFSTVNMNPMAYQAQRNSVHVAADGSTITALMWADDVKPSGFEYIRIPNIKTEGISQMTRTPIFEDHVTANNVTLGTYVYHSGRAAISDDGLSVTMVFDTSTSAKRVVIVQTTDGFVTSKEIEVPGAYKTISSTRIIVNPYDQSSMACICADKNYASITRDGGLTWKEAPELLKIPEGLPRYAQPEAEPMLQSESYGGTYWVGDFLFMFWEWGTPYQVHKIGPDGSVESTSEIDYKAIQDTDSYIRLFVRPSNDPAVNEIDCLAYIGKSNAVYAYLGGKLAIGKSVPDAPGYKVVSDRFKES